MVMGLVRIQMRRAAPRISTTLGLAALCFAGTACERNYSIQNGGTPPPPSAANTLPPPANLEGGAATPASPGGWDGTYAGEATWTSGPQWACPQHVPMVDFRVSGARVSFGGFSGSIQSNGSVQMAYGTTWIAGQFSPGGQFDGNVSQDGGTCTWRISLTRNA
jgi:hypothetical protein